jgi:DNA topoisomerase-3
MSKVPKCLLKINKKLFEEKEPELKLEPEPEPEQEQQEEEPEIHFNRKKNKQEKETPEQEFIKQQKKIGLICHCGLETVLREVKKDGPNKGKMFYTCYKSYDDKCNYFMWKDEPENKINKQIQTNETNTNKTNTNTNETNTNTDENSTNTNETNTNTDENSSNTDEPIPMSEKEIKQQQKLGLMCNCKLPSVSREVKKDGPNKGKIFYTCSRYFDDKCKYFVWKDEIKK